MSPGSRDAFAGMAARHPANERRPWSALLWFSSQDELHRLHGVMISWQTTNMMLGVVWCMSGPGTKNIVLSECSTKYLHSRSDQLIWILWKLSSLVLLFEPLRKVFHKSYVFSLDQSFRNHYLSRFQPAGYLCSFLWTSAGTNGCVPKPTASTTACGNSSSSSAPMQMASGHRCVANGPSWRRATKNQTLEIPMKSLQVDEKNI